MGRDPRDPPPLHLQPNFRSTPRSPARGTSLTIGRRSIVIKDSPGFYYFASALFGVVAVIMLFAAYWSFEAEETFHVAFSLLVTLWSLWITRMCFRRANALGKKE